MIHFVSYFYMLMCLFSPINYESLGDKGFVFFPFVLPTRKQCIVQNRQSTLLCSVDLRMVPYPSGVMF